MAKRCLFCPATKLSREHVWPDWVVGLFDEHIIGPGEDVTAAMYTHRARTHTWRQRDLTHTARLVCRGCNMGWMSEIEGSARPRLRSMILGTADAARLDALDSVTIAAWCCLRAIVFDALAPKPHQPYFTQAERDAFRESLAPPPHTHLWLAAYEGGRNRGAQFDVIAHVNRAEGGGAFVGTWIVNKLIVQVRTWKGAPPRVLDERRLRRAGWDAYTTRLWPASRASRHWRPSAQLDDEGYKLLLNRFRPARDRFV
jgi:hypothetical protein